MPGWIKSRNSSTSAAVAHKAMSKSSKERSKEDLRSVSNTINSSNSVIDNQRSINYGEITAAIQNMISTYLQADTTDRKPKVKSLMQNLHKANLTTLDENEIDEYINDVITRSESRYSGAYLREVASERELELLCSLIMKDSRSSNKDPGSLKHSMNKCLKDFGLKLKNGKLAKILEVYFLEKFSENIISVKNNQTPIVNNDLSDDQPVAQSTADIAADSKNLPPQKESTHVSSSQERLDFIENTSLSSQERFVKNVEKEPYNEKFNPFHGDDDSLDVSRETDSKTITTPVARKADDLNEVEQITQEEFVESNLEFAKNAQDFLREYCESNKGAMRKLSASLLNDQYITDKSNKNTKDQVSGFLEEVATLSKEQILKLLNDLLKDRSIEGKFYNALKIFAKENNLILQINGNNKPQLATSTNKQVLIKWHDDSALQNLTVDLSVAAKGIIALVNEYINSGNYTEQDKHLVSIEESLSSLGLLDIASHDAETESRKLRISEVLENLRIDSILQLANILSALLDGHGNNGSLFKLIDSLLLKVSVSDGKPYGVLIKTRNSNTLSVEYKCSSHNGQSVRVNTPIVIQPVLADPDEDGLNTIEAMARHLSKTLCKNGLIDSKRLLSIKKDLGSNFVIARDLDFNLIVRAVDPNKNLSQAEIGNVLEKFKLEGTFFTKARDMSFNKELSKLQQNLAPDSEEGKRALSSQWSQAEKKMNFHSKNTEKEALWYSLTHERSTPNPATKAKLDAAITSYVNQKMKRNEQSFATLETTAMTKGGNPLRSKKFDQIRVEKLNDKNQTALAKALNDKFMTSQEFESKLLEDLTDSRFTDAQEVAKGKVNSYRSDVPPNNAIILLATQKYNELLIIKAINSFENSENKIHVAMKEKMLDSSEADKIISGVKKDGDINRMLNTTQARYERLTADLIASKNERVQMLKAKLAELSANSPLVQEHIELLEGRIKRRDNLYDTMIEHAVLMVSGKSADVLGKVVDHNAHNKLQTTQTELKIQMKLATWVKNPDNGLSEDGRDALLSKLKSIAKKADKVAASVLANKAKKSQSVWSLFNRRMKGSILAKIVSSVSVPAVLIGTVATVLLVVFSAGVAAIAIAALITAAALVFGIIYGGSKLYGAILDSKLHGSTLDTHKDFRATFGLTADIS